MEIEGARAVVTGGGSGIGAAIARALGEAGAAAVVVADLDQGAALATAEEFGGIGIGVDVGRESEIRRLVAEAEEAVGPIDLFFSNAGIAGPNAGPEAGDEDWQRIWEINVMAHVWAARILLPGMLERGHGHLSSTASAAALLASPGVMAYSVTKHAALAVAEWLAITYGGPESGVSFSCFCPQGVATPLLADWEAEDPKAAIAASGGVITPDEAAAALLKGVREGSFLVYSHDQARELEQRRAADHDVWIDGLRRFLASVEGPDAKTDGV